jgi:hypothetical protein
MFQGLLSLTFSPEAISSANCPPIGSECPRKTDLEKVFSDINVEPKMLSQLSPAINAGKSTSIDVPRETARQRSGNGSPLASTRISIYRTQLWTAVQFVPRFSISRA